MKNLILVINDGGSNFRCFIYNSEDLNPVEKPLIFPSSVFQGNDGYLYNDIPDTIKLIINKLPKFKYTNKIKIIVPVVRGATIDLLDNNLKLLRKVTDIKTGKKRVGVQSYSSPLSAESHKAFNEIASPEERYYFVGSDMNNGLIPARTIIDWVIKKPQLLKTARYIAFLPEIIGSFFIDNNRKNFSPEITYTACHTCLYDFKEKDWSNIAKKIDRFVYQKIGKRLIGNLIPQKIKFSYDELGKISSEIATKTKINKSATILHGIHDSTSGDIPIIANFLALNLPEKNLLHFQAGSFGMARYIQMTEEFKPKCKKGNKELNNISLPENGLHKGILLQGDFFGNRVITAMTPIGYEFAFYKELFSKRLGFKFENKYEQINIDLISKILKKGYFIIPGSRKLGKNTGQFPNAKGRIIEPEDKDSKTKNSIYDDKTGNLAYYTLNLSTAIQAFIGIKTIINNKKMPIILSGGGAKDKLFTKILTTLLEGYKVFIIKTKDGNIASETASDGGAMVGKAYLEGKKSPYLVDISKMDYKLEQVFPLGIEKKLLNDYIEKFIQHCNS